MNIDRSGLVRVFAALGDPTRLGILQAVALQDRSPDALAGELGVSGNLLAHHLKVLLQSGLVRRSHSQHDRRRCYIQSAMADWPGLASLLDVQVRLRVPRVVFVCTHNSARSVLAEALWYQASSVPAASAGTSPASGIHPRARRAARTLSLPLRTSHPRHVHEVLRPDDLVVSVCDGVNEELPSLVNPRLHWSIPDPSAIDTDRAFAEAAGALRHRVQRLATHVSHASQASTSVTAHPEVPMSQEVR